MLQLTIYCIAAYGTGQPAGLGEPGRRLGHTALLGSLQDTRQSYLPLTGLDSHRPYARALTRTEAAIFSGVMQWEAILTHIELIVGAEASRHR